MTKPESEWATCPHCAGAAEVVPPYARRDWETGIWDSEICRGCGGDGHVPSHVANYLRQHEAMFDNPEDFYDD